MAKRYKAKWILQSNQRVIENGILSVKNGIITDIYRENELPYTSDIIDLGNAVITPGFINLHCHLQYTDLKKDENLEHNKFSEWVIDLIKKYIALTDEQKRQSVVNGVNEALLSGTTTIVQITKDDFPIDFYKKLPLRKYLFFETFANTTELSHRQFSELKEKLDQYQKYTDNHTFFGISPHSIYNVHPELWKLISKYSLENDVLIHTHLAESAEEMKWARGENSDIDELHRFVGWNSHNPSFKTNNPVEFLEHLSVLNKNLITAHLNQLNSESFKLIAKHDVKIAYCPRSNMFLHGKTLNIENALEIIPFENIGIGTDSKFSNKSLNLLDEARFIKSNSKLGLLKIIDMLTINAARILRLDHLTGSLDKCKFADFLVFKLEEKQTYLDILSKDKPDMVFIEGKQVNICQ